MSFFAKISVSKILKESGSTWDVDVKLPKFAENADKEFEKIVAFINKVLSWKKKIIISKVLTECWVLLQPQNWKKANFLAYMANFGGLWV